MADSKYYPDEWKAFCALVNNGKALPSPSLSRFAARYRSAGNFQRAEFFGLSDDLSAGYSAIIKVMLCYSAFEILCEAIALNIREQQIVDAGCAKALRAEYSDASSDAFPLKAALTNKTLLQRLDAFLNNASDDILPFATALRHLFAHGFWTPNGGEAVSRRARQTLDALSLALLWKSDQVFSGHVLALSGEAPAASSVKCEYDVAGGKRILIVTDDDESFATVCRALECAELTTDPRFGRPGRDSPAWNRKRKTMDPGGLRFQRFMPSCRTDWPR